MKVGEAGVSEGPAGGDVEASEALHGAELRHSQLGQSGVWELPAAGEGEGGEVGQVLGDVSHAHVRDLGVLQAQPLQHLQPGLVVEEAGPGVPGAGQQPVQGRVRQVGHVAEVEVLRKWGGMC